MEPRPAISIAPLPTLDGFAEAAAESGEALTTPARLQAVIRVLAEAARASLADRFGNAPYDAGAAPPTRRPTV